MNRFAKAKFSCFVKWSFAFFVLPFSIYFTTCDMPMGLGDPIDWEPPVLTIVPAPPNPMYVRQGAVLAGTVTDNIGVDRVILREASTGTQLFRATVNGDRWEVVMEFTEEQNNEKIAIEIVAFDKAGNSGDQSMAAVTLVVDIGPPIIEDIWIQRTEIKTASLEQLTTIDGGGLQDLETRDPRGERSANANRYQNGFFTIAGNVAETETRIEIVSLDIYDVREPDTALLQLPKNEDSTNFSPRWLVSEEALLAAGEALWPGTGYSTNYRNGERYYYRVAVTALDKSENESESLIRVEDEGFFCMWEKADMPKGIIDPVIGISNPIIVTKGATLPVEFYDDDQLAWAFTGLLTEQQWNGSKDIASGVTIPSGSDESKLQWLRNRLVDKTGAVYNWRYDRYNPEITTANGQTNEITDLTEGKAIDEKVYYVQTGGNDQDNGAYVLFSLVSDTKLPPHTGTGPYATNRPRESLNVWRVDVIDENEPLIVFDTIDTNDSGYILQNQSWIKHPGGTNLEKKGTAYETGNSPEENTFPKLTGGQYFTLNGYTLRANKLGEQPGESSTNNKVLYFRMAWIPFGIEGGADSYITRVQEALQANGYPNDGHPRPNGTVGPNMNTLEARGIQHWDFIPTDTAAYPNPTNDAQLAANRGKLLLGTNQNLNGDYDPKGDIFTKQIFKKTFDILGGTDDIKDGQVHPEDGTSTPRPLYKNFTYNGVLENETKLFVIYAEDDMGHVVFRQIRLLGNKTPPNLIVYDITSRDEITFPQNYDDGTNPQLPNLNYTNPNNTLSHVANGYYFFRGGIIDDISRANYATKLKNFQPAAYTLLETSVGSTAVGPGERAEPNSAYTRETIVKYWVTASESGQLGVRSIHMRDITFKGTEQLPDEPESVWLARTQVGNYDPDKNMLSYVELLPEVTQRVFMFTATDTLGNVARVQRTLAVTNAAVLTSITTSSQSGKYGISANTSPSSPITLQANFSNLVQWTGTAPPLLNVRFKRNGVETIQSIPTETPANTPVLSLEFDFNILEGDTGVLQTMYHGIEDDSGEGYVNQGNDTNLWNRPLRIPAGTEIKDVSRGDKAFVPKYTTGFDWTEEGRGPDNSLQGSKRIELDGIRPTLNTFVHTSSTGKTGYAEGFYYKTDDVLTFTLTASKDIFTNGSPIVQFQFTNGGTWYNSVPWQSSSGSTMVFSVQVHSKDVSVPNTTIPEGAVTGIRLNNVSTIVDSVGNAFASGTGSYNTNMNISTGNNAVHIDKTGPNAPVTTLSGPKGGAIPVSDPLFNYAPRFTIAIDSDTGETYTPPKIEFSLDNGINWDDYPSGGYPVGATNGLPNGTHAIVTRFTDRAGNVGALRSQVIEVNQAFPNLIAATAVDSTGWHKTGENLSFTLDFADRVIVDTAASIQIVLTGRAGAFNQNGTGENNVLLTASAVQPSNSTIKFEWNNITGKEMRNGMYISRINLAGLKDRFGNSGPVAANITYSASEIAPSPISGTFSSTPVNNLNVNVKVDAILPTVDTRVPAINGVSAYPTSTTDKRNVITLTFREPVMKGSGTITIKPSSDSLIPPVFEDNGYYLNQFSGTNSDTEVKATTSSNLTTWVPGFYDIYNNSALDATDRNRLTQSTTEGSQRTSPSTGLPSSVVDPTNPSMTRLVLDERTGQSVGPYVKTTHGLIGGAGYTGNYSGTYSTTTSGPNTNDGRTTEMIPDTSTKWVLAYRYGIHGGGSINAGAAYPNELYSLPSNAANTTLTFIADDAQVVPRIKAVLEKAKFRWQEIDIVSSTVQVNGSTVTITLNEPLLKGLKWELSYPDGTFTDEAGNNTPAQASPQESYIFWSAGAQKPVIRVDRRSYDARTAAWKTPTTGNNTAGYTYSEPQDGSGWGLGSFNTINYRIESETPGATIHYGASALNNSTTGDAGAPYNAVTGAWTGAIANPLTTAVNWNTAAATSETKGNFWVRPNLIRRTGVSGGEGDRNIFYVNGDQRRSSGNLRMFRSYNADATVTTLSNIILALGTANRGWQKDSVTFGALEAGKSYVAAEARITNGGNAYISNKGYEGVFRTVIMLNNLRGIYNNYTGTNGSNANAAARNRVVVEGSNIKSGTPSIAGFPVQDGAETGDSRFVKMMNNNGDRFNFTWVSTEIVCEWYFLYFGNGGDVMRTGEVNNYIMVGYGDLTYGYRVDHFPDPGSGTNSYSNSNTTLDNNTAN